MKMNRTGLFVYRLKKILTFSLKNEIPLYPLLPERIPLGKRGD